MLKSRISSKRLNLPAEHAWLLLVCQIFNLVLLFNEITTWMFAIISLCLCWRILMLVKPELKPNRIMLLLLSCSGCIAIAISGWKLGVLLSMLHLLCFAYALKSLELNSRNDFYQIILLGIFVLASSLIFSQSLFISLLVLCLLALNLNVLLGYFSPKIMLSKSIKQSAKAVIQSIPLAIVLFIVFPRLAPFWQVPSAKSAQTGLSESVTPGDIATLARSTKLAFRVDFFNDKPQYSQLYWRAMVMEDFNGRTWQQNKKNEVKPSANENNRFIASLQLVGKPTRYQVIAEPSYQKWLFSLAVVDSKSITANQSDIIALNKYTIENSKPISQSTSYQVTSYNQSLLNSPISAQDRLINLRIPSNSNPKLQAYGKSLALTYPDESQRAQAILNIIREQNYFYTLTPPLLSGDELDQFFYQTKKGFCVHYASAFAFIMRASGIPARLVTGYLGGEFNEQSGHFSIYQYDAHAWTEIWIEDKGWVRVDPTAAVNPERISTGLADMLQEDELFNNNLLNLHRYKHLAWVNSLRMQLDALDYQWTSLVIGYSSKKQFELLSNWLGQLRAWKIAAIIGGSLFVMMLIMWLANLTPSKAKRKEKWLVQYQQTIMLLKAKGLVKPLNMPASEFSDLVCQRFPLLNNSFLAYTQCFEALMYQTLTATQKKQRFIEMNYWQQQIKKQLKQVKRS